MQTVVQTLKKTLKFFIISTILFSYSGVFAETLNNDMEHAQHIQDWSGVYQGFTPCADCIGVKTSLALNPNNTYILITQNTGKSAREFTEKGKFAWADKSNTIVLTPRNNAAAKRQYLSGADTLTELDSNGNPFTGKDAERYTLRKVDVTGKSTKHQH